MRKENNGTFSKRLQGLIDSEKITQVAVARGLAVHSAKITGWLKGDVKTPQRKTIYKMCDFFGCDFDWLKDGTGEPFPENETETVAVTYKSTSEETASQSKEEAAPTVRHYRELAEMDTDTFGEIQTWVNDMEKLRPGFTSWFRLEFQTRFPEFDEWKMKQQKKSGRTDSQDGFMEIKSANGE